MQFGRPPPDPATSPQLSVLRRPSPAHRTPEEEADRERERRRRREGSERGSSHPSRRHNNSDTRSRGSRSSEGSESLRDRERGRGEGDSGAKAYLKASYKEIGALEQSLGGMHRKMDSDPEAGISVLLDPSERNDPSRRNDINAWAELVSMHKKLADCHHHFLKISLDPQVPPGLRQSPLRYNIPVRLWQVGFHLLLERLRFAWMSHNAIAHDLLTDFIYYAYQFYNGLYEDDMLSSFRSAWIEALGDLARYRMAVACAEGDSEDAAKQKKAREARIDDGDSDNEQPIPSGASIGQEVADNWDVEERETWRVTARDWYAKGIIEKPGEGRLHHHLALLCRDVRGREGHALYHFTKSLCASHPFETSRESVLPLFDSALQYQRSAPEATAMDLFVRLHGMLFTKIQLDDFSTVMSRFMERLEEDANLDGVSRKACVTQVDWLLMGVVNLTAMLQYGAESGPIRKALAQEGAARRRQHIADGIAEQAEPDGDDDASQATEPVEEPPVLSDGPPPVTFTHALELAFTVLDFVFKHPFRQQGLYQVLNPYLTTLLTFLATIFRHPAAGAPLVTSMPWRHLADFLNSQGLELREETRLVTPAPLPEDWMMRGMEWIGRRVYERGFWKTKSNSRGSSGGPAVPRSGERFQSEMDVLLANFDSGLDLNEGVVEDETADQTDGPVAVNERRRRRLAWAAGVLAAHVEGFVIEDGRVAIRGVLAQVIDAQEAQRAREKAEADAWLARRPKDTEELSDSDDDDPALAVVREQRRHLRSVLKLPTGRSGGRKARTPKSTHRIVPGYTILVFDTNVLLGSLSLFARLVEGGQWSVIVPLPVVTELDGLSRNPPPLGSEASSAVGYLEARIRTHALTLKIQTTRGNYLTDLLIRAEHLDFKASVQNASKSMDDLILDVAAFQARHFQDRSGILGMPAPEDKATQVLLITFDRNMRLKARARGIEAADERELATILGK